MQWRRLSKLWRVQLVKHPRAAGKFPLPSQAHTEKTSDVKALHVMQEWETRPKCFSKVMQTQKHTHSYKPCLHSPAMGGPTVIGTDMSPSRNPMAWETSWAPTSSKAIGAIMQMKHPSNRPMKRQTATRAPKTLHSGIIIDISPIKKNEAT